MSFFSRSKKSVKQVQFRFKKSRDAIDFYNLVDVLDVAEKVKRSGSNVIIKKLRPEKLDLVSNLAIDLNGKLNESYTPYEQIEDMVVTNLDNSIELFEGGEISLLEAAKCVLIESQLNDVKSKHMFKEMINECQNKEDLNRLKLLLNYRKV